MTDDIDNWIDKFLDRVGAPDDARRQVGPAEREQVKRWLDGLSPDLRSQFLDGGPDHPILPMGKASLRWVEGQGYVHVPHLYRVTFKTPIGDDATYEVQTFLGPDKATSIATQAHTTRNRPWHHVEVEELGPTEAGGSLTAIDDRAEW